MWSNVKQCEAMWSIQSSLGEKQPLWCDEVLSKQDVLASTSSCQPSTGVKCTADNRCNIGNSLCLSGTCLCQSGCLAKHRTPHPPTILVKYTGLIDSREIGKWCWYRVWMVLTILADVQFCCWENSKLCWILMCIYIYIYIHVYYVASMILNEHGVSMCNGPLQDSALWKRRMSRSYIPKLRQRSQATRLASHHDH